MTRTHIVARHRPLLLEAAPQGVDVSFALAAARRSLA
jgi:hypothetical protein